MKIWLTIAAGGAIGAVSRYGLSTLIHSFAGRNFPYGTLSVNVLGSFFIGCLSILFLSRIPLAAEWRAFVLVGILGAFTTFSSFSFETLALVERGEIMSAILNTILNLVLCLTATWLGLFLGRVLS